MNQIISRTYGALGWIMLVLLSYVFIFTVFLRTPSLTMIPSFIVIFLCVPIMGFLLFLNHLRNILIKNDKIFYIALSCIVILTRLIWILLVNTKPISDFRIYYTYGCQFSNGFFKVYDKTCYVFPHRIGYALILSMFFKIFGGYSSLIKILNILLSLFSAFTIYFIGNKIINKEIGKIAAFLFALWPSQIMYSSVIASEHFFILFFLLSILIFILSAKNEKISNKIILYILCAFSISVSQFTRPIAIMLIPIFFLYNCFISSSSISIIKSIIHSLKITCIISVFYLIFFGSFCGIAYKLTDINMFKSSFGYNLLVGTNCASNGMYNKMDAQILYQYKCKFSRVHYEAQKRAISRIQGNPSNFVRLLERKYDLFWGDDTFGSSWSLASLNKETKFTAFLKNNRRSLNLLNQSFYICILFLAIIGTLYTIKEKIGSATVIFFVFFVHFIAYSFLEIQSRYHYPAIILILILSSYGMLKLNDALHNYYFKKHPEEQPLTI